MPLVDPVQDLTADQLAAAEAMLAAHLGTYSLEAREVIETGVVARNGLIMLRDGPASAVVALTVGGVIVGAALTTPHSIDLSPGVTPYGRQYGYAGATYQVTFIAGWPKANVPPPVYQGIIALAKALAARPDLTVKAEGLGPMSRQYDSMVELPPMVAAMARPYRRLML